jgi:hypothetical protein
MWTTGTGMMLCRGASRKRRMWCSVHIRTANMRWGCGRRTCITQGTNPPARCIAGPFKRGAACLEWHVAAPVCVSHWLTASCTCFLQAHYLQMRDGVRVAVDILRPAAGHFDETHGLPCVLIQTRYFAMALHNEA